MTKYSFFQIEKRGKFDEEKNLPKRKTASERERKRGRNSRKKFIDVPLKTFA